MRREEAIHAEFRFIRAYVYFELVKRMGGVPLITTQLIYNGSGDPSSLQNPRAKESEVYDFIYNEIQDIKDNFTQTEGSRTRANKITGIGSPKSCHAVCRFHCQVQQSDERSHQHGGR